MEHSEHHSLSSQLILRRGADQMALGTTLSPSELLEEVQNTLASQSLPIRPERLWAELCRAVISRSRGRSPLALSIPASPGLPTVWVSQLDSASFSLATDNSLNPDGWEIFRLRETLGMVG